MKFVKATVNVRKGDGTIVGGIQYEGHTKNCIYIVQKQPTQIFYAVNYKWTRRAKNKSHLKMFKQVEEHFGVMVPDTEFYQK